MLLDVLKNPIRRPRVLHIGIAVRPIASVVQRVPRRAQIGTCLRCVSMLAESVADSDFIVPNRFEEVDQIVFRRALPSGLHNQCAVFEILQPQACPSPFAMFLRCSLRRPESLSPCSIAVLAAWSAGSALPT